FSSRRRHTRSYGDWSSDVCSSDLMCVEALEEFIHLARDRDHFGSKQRKHGLKTGVLLRRIVERWIEARIFLSQVREEVRPRPVRSEERRVGKEWRSRWWPGD